MSWLGGHPRRRRREVNGDVTVIAQLDVRGTTSAAPTVDWSLAGLMLRAPGQQGAESWVHWTAGQIGGPVLERKSTRSGRSQLALVDIDPGPVTLQLIRAGEHVILLHRRGAEQWTRDAVYGRPDLPATAEILLTAQSGGEADRADMVALFDRVEITPGAPPVVVLNALLAGDASGLPL